jgi:organic radical activating enzyme
MRNAHSKIMIEISSLFRNRHWHVVKRHLTAKKLLNITRGLISYCLGWDRTHSFPIYAKIETTDACHLRCPGCRYATGGRKNARLNYDLYKGLIDDLKDYLIEVSLYDQGEPLLDQRIHSFVNYASARNIGTSISTSLSMPLSDRDLDKLVLSGLDYLIVSIDGITQSVYEKYRKGGDLNLVFNNLTRLIQFKRKRNLKKPFVEWQMIDLHANRHQQREASVVSQRIGCDFFLVKPDYRQSLPPSHYQRKTRCSLPWFSFAVECDGLVSACLAKDHDTLFVGDLNRDSILTVWNSEKSVAIRRDGTNNKYGNLLFCGHCNRFD